MTVGSRYFEEHGLTKRTRVRVQHRFGRSDLVVVQVEVHGAWIEDRLDGHFDSDCANRWRDARIEDFGIPELPPVRDASTA